jgi:hypothetical protein
MKTPRAHHAAKTTKVAAARVWREIEELMIPALRPWPAERLLYFYLLRQTRLAGRRTILVSATQLARATAFAPVTVRVALKRLAAKQALRVLERGRDGQRFDVRLPLEIRGCARAARAAGKFELDTADFFANQRLRTAIYRREKHRCFYCRRRLRFANRVLDHVLPRARGGGNSHRNVVASCLDCNSSKGETNAADFLRSLVRRGVLTPQECVRRRRAIEQLKMGNRKPALNPHHYRPEKSNT